MRKFQGIMVAGALISTLPCLGYVTITNGVEWWYEVYDGTATITGIPISTSGVAEIPSELDGYLVTSIGQSAFKYCSGLTSVTNPDSVTSIGSEAFYSCRGLTSVTIGNGVTSIGRSAFYNCNGLTSVTIGNGVTSIGENAFSGCSGLASVTIPNSVTSIGAYAFEKCIGMNNVTIGKGVTSIGYSAFSGCSGLTSLTIPDNVTSIGMYAFENCSSLKNVTISQYVCNNRMSSVFSSTYSSSSTYLSITNVVISEGVTNIGHEAFADCSGLIGVTIPDSVTDVGENAFRGCESLYDTTTIPGAKLVDGWVVGYSESLAGLLDLTGVRGIANAAFIYCSSLTSVTIPDSVTSIGKYTFYACSGLTSVTIGNGVTSIGDYAFSGCSELASVYVSDLEAWCRISFGNESANPLIHEPNLYVASKLLRKLVVPDGVTEIKPYAFRFYVKLTSVTIPNSVTNIGNGAFSYCSGLTGVSMGNGVKNIGEDAFSYCSALESVTILDSVVNIGDGAFYDCSALTNMTIGDSVTSIGASAFFGCRGLVNIVLPNSLTDIGRAAFQGCERLIEVTIPDKVTNIKEHVFHDCFDLENIILSEGVTNIGEYAFYQCNDLSNITIPEGVTIIENFAFGRCSSLKAVTMSGRLTSVGNQAFQYCDSLTAIHINDLAAWCGIVFENADANPLSSAHHLYMDGKELTGIVIPDGVERIEDFAFSGGEALKWVVVPASVESIGYQAFAGCSNLERVYFVGDAPETDGDIFSGASGNLTVYAAEGTVGWHSAGSQALPSAWPEDDGSNARAIANGAPAFVDVTLDANGGEWADGTPSVCRLAGVDVAGTLPVPMRDGYGFIGWFTEREAGAKVATNMVVTADMGTLYAHWGNGVELESGGDADWTQGEGGVWRSGSIGGYQTSWMTASVYGEGEVSFRWMVSCNSYYAQLYFYVDGVQQEAIGGDVGWSDRTFVVSGNGEHTLKWAYTKTYNYTSGEDCGWVNEVAWTPYVRCTVTLDANGGDLAGAASSMSVIKGKAIGDLPVPTLDGRVFAGWWTAAEGGEQVTAATMVRGALALVARWETSPYIFGGDAVWTLDDGGVWRSGAIGDNEESWMQMDVSGAGQISFRWRTSSEAYKSTPIDYVIFSVDGEVRTLPFGGETQWTNVVVDVAGDGNHALRWTYSKDEADSAGADCAWVDAVTWTSSGPVDEIVDMGGGKTVTVPQAWLNERTQRAATATAANGRKVWECYMLGLDPESNDATNDFRITSVPMKADGTPDLANIALDPPQSRWNVPATYKVKGAVNLDDVDWPEVTDENKASLRFFKVELVLP